MTIESRLTRAEEALPDALLWLEAQWLAPKLGLNSPELYEEAVAILETYGHLLTPAPNGRIDIKPAVRAMADKEASTTTSFSETRGGTYVSGADVVQGDEHERLAGEARPALRLSG